MLTTEVFGVSNKEVASYIERNEVDLKFVEGLDMKKHIIVFGASKQGKTALTNKHLQENSFIRVNCSPETTTLDIYKSILRQHNIEFEEEKTTKTMEGSEVKASVKASVKIPFLGSGEVGSGVSGKSAKETEVKYKNIEYNLALPQDISEILMNVSFNKRIILENFHYLEDAVQTEMAFHLRIFEDFNVLFIVLGIWREKNRLTQYNGDLQDRLIEIPVEPWHKRDFEKVALKGSALLNVSFTDVLEKIIENSFDSIGVFQELCKECCIAAEVINNQVNQIKINPAHLDIAVAKKLADYSGRHIRSFETFVEQKAKSSDATPLYIAFYFIKYLLEEKFHDIENGLKRSVIHEKIKAIHHRPDDVRSSDMSNFLHYITSTQIKKKIIPPLFDYDRSTRTLKVIDSTLYFFLRNTNRAEILEELDSPVDK